MVYSVSKSYNGTQKDPVEVFPSEIILKIFSYLKLSTLGTICSVSKEWKRLASEPNLWKTAIYRELAFGNEKWIKYCGINALENEDNKEEFSSLPWKEFIADCKKFKKIFPGKNGKDILMLVRLPKTLNGGLNLRNLGKIAKTHFLNTETGYQSIWPRLIEEKEDKSINTSKWVLMIKDVIPESRNKSYRQQKKIVSGLVEEFLTGYEIPGILESATCILSQYFDSKTFLFSKKPPTYTRCQENIKGYQVVVGGFSEKGLCVNFNCYDYENFGIAVLRKF